MYKFWSFFIRKRSFSYLLLTALIVFGFFSILTIPRESNPEVQVPIAIVSTPYPGASALEVEQLVTNKIEAGLKGGLEDLKKLTSTSREGLSVIVAEFEASADIDESVQATKDEVDKVKNELPGEADEVFVTEVDFVNQPIQLISISSDLAPSQFARLADDIVDELKKVPGVSSVVKSGVRSREVQVIVDKNRLNNFGLNISDVSRAISIANNSLPVGSINIDDIDYSVRFEGDIEDPSEIEDIAILNKAGQAIYVRDVAFVSDGLERASSISRVSIDGDVAKQSITLSVFKSRGGDITKISEAVRDKLDELESSLLRDTEVLISLDIGEFIKEDLTRLSFTGLQTVILVMIILFITIGWRESIIAGLAIPLSFLMGFIGLINSGNTINFVSLFSLILAIGILVDSAIVITEAIHTKMKSFMDKRESALQSIKELHSPLTSGTLTTIAVFAPLFLISGVAGQFIASIPFTIIFVLTASLIVALGIIPLIASIFLRRRTTSRLEERQEVLTTTIQRWYRNFLGTFLGNRKKEKYFIIGIIAAFFLSLALPISGIVQTTFFAQEDADFIFVELEEKQGTSLEKTDITMRSIEEVLYEDERIESFVTTVGSNSSFANDGSSGENLGNITIILKDNRDKKSTEIMEDLRDDLSVIKTARVSVFQPSSGPPVGKPVVIKFIGDDLDRLQEYAFKAEGLLKTIEGTSEVDAGGRNEGIDFILEIDRAKASELGISSGQIAETLRTSVYGITATTIKNPDEDIDVVVKLNLNNDYLDPHDTTRANIDSVEHIAVQTPNGPVLLGSLLKSELGKSTPTISHEDRERFVNVTSELAPGGITSKILKDFEDRVDELELPSDISYVLGGENQETDQSFQDMFVALIIGMILVLSILVLQFNSFRHALYIISIVPLALIGILAGLAITGKTLSFPSLMGFIALSGIVVNNSIILVDVMNKIRRANPDISIHDVVVEGSVRRLRPILLTTLTTVIGIIPLTYASELWSPLAFSIMFGLTFAVILTLVLIPILYSRWPGKLKD